MAVAPGPHHCRARGGHPPMPKLALLPLALILFGIGEESKVC